MIAGAVDPARRYAAAYTPSGDVAASTISTKNGAVRLTPPIRMTLEKALAYIEDDELIEVTPKSIRLRKKLLDENERKRADRAKEAETV